MATIRELKGGVQLDPTVVPNEYRRDVEALCRLLSTCLTDLVVTLSFFERSVAEENARNLGWKRGLDDSERNDQRRDQLRAEIEAREGVSWGHPGYAEKAAAIYMEVERTMLREEWARGVLPVSYARRLPFIHAESFVSTLALLQRSLLALKKYPFDTPIASRIKKACDDFEAAVPGLKDVRDSVAHAEDRVRGKTYEKKISPQPVTNSLVHSPHVGAMVTGSLSGQRYGGTTRDGIYAEVEIADATTDIARAAVQAVYDALPWLGVRFWEPS